MLASINDKISGFNYLVKDDLVEQGAQADRAGNRAAFVWNGIQYAIYNTVMPNSVQEAAIDTVGGPIIGKSLGWLGKIATHLWPGLGKGIGNLASGLLTFRLGLKGEDAVRAAYNIGRPRFIQMNGIPRRPDGVLGKMGGFGILSEIKNVASQSYTRQLCALCLGLS